MMQLIYSESSRTEVDERTTSLNTFNAVSADSDPLQLPLPAFDQLNYLYGAIAANCFLELEALR